MSTVLCVPLKSHWFAAALRKRVFSPRRLCMSHFSKKQPCNKTHKRTNSNETGREKEGEGGRKNYERSLCGSRAHQQMGYSGREGKTNPPHWDERPRMTSAQIDWEWSNQTNQWPRTHQNRQKNFHHFCDCERSVHILARVWDRCDWTSWGAQWATEPGEGEKKRKDK